MTRTTWIYVIVFCLLGLASVVKVSLPEGPEPIAFKLPALKPEEVSKLVITKGETAVTLEKAPDGKGWNVTAPFTYPADNTNIESILRNFEKETLMDMLVSSDPKDHTTYELLPDQAVKLEVYKGTSLETALYIGKNASGGTSYIRPVNSEEVYRAKTVTKARLEKPAAEWRDKKIFDLKPEEITRLEITGGPQPLTVAREGGKWKALEPADLQVDQNTVDGLARTFSTLRAADILEKADGETGLDAPTLKVVATLKEGTRTLLVGKEKETATRYVQREGDPQLFTVRDGLLDTFRKDRNNLRDKAIFSFDAEQINHVLIARDDKKVVLAKVKGEPDAAGKAQEGWKVAEQVGVTVDMKAIQQVMAGITTLRVATYQDGVTPEAAGFITHALQVELGTQDGSRVMLTVGTEKAEGEYYATRSSDGAVFTLRGFALNGFKQVLGEPVQQPPGPKGGLPPGLQLPPGVQLPPGLNLN